MRKIPGLVVGIPTLNQYTRLTESIASIVNGTVWPELLIVVDNGRSFAGLANVPFPVEFIRPPYNLGVAASWNLMGRLISHDDIVYMNDDFIMAKDGLEWLHKCSALLSCDSKHRYACFKVRSSLWSAIGEFDEGFWPGNFEDMDISHRMELLGLKLTASSKPLGDHPKPHATQAGYNADWMVAFKRNERRYQDKWQDGVHPWPKGKLNELEWSFNDYKQNAVDMGMYFDLLRKLAEDHAHIVEFGTEHGHSSLAFLAGQPASLTCYDKEIKSMAGLLYPLSGSTRVTLHQADVLSIPPVNADLLFIDTYHTGTQVEAELERHYAGIRKRILLHDVVAYGEKGQDGKSGLLSGINAFLARHKEWVIKDVVNSWPGMMLLARSESAGVTLIV